MTACTNKARGAVVAALAGALSLGAVPAVALATGSGEASPLIATTADQVENATVTEGQDNAGQPVQIDGTQEFTWDGKAHYVVPTWIANSEAFGSMRVNDENGLTVSYVKVVDAPTANSVEFDGHQVEWLGQGNYPTDAGTYYAVVKSADDTSVAGNKAFVKFDIVDRTYSDVKVVSSDGSSIVYDGSQKVLGADIKLVSAGRDLVGGSDYKNGNDEIAIWDKDDVNHTNIGWPTKAGDYVMEVTFNLAGGKTVDRQIPFTIEKLDLSTADIVLAGASGSVANYATTATELPTKIVSINGTKVSDTKTNGLHTLGDATLQLECSYDGNFSKPEKGSYTFTVRSWRTGSGSENTPSDNVTGTGKVTVVRYENQGQIRYNKQNLVMGGTDTTKGMFDPSQIDAVKPGTNEKLDVTITYTRNGEPTEDITAPGHYVATITISDGSYAWGGQAKLEFTVSATRIDIDEIYASYKGETLKSGSVRDIYSGSDLMENFSVKAIDEDDNEVPAEAFDVVVTNAKGEKVDSVVEAGTYTITIKAAEGSVYDIEGGSDTVTFTVDPVKVLYTSNSGSADNGANSQVRFTGTIGYGQNANVDFVYTGEAVVPGYEYDLTDNIASWGYNLFEEWNELPADSYKATYQKWNEKTGRWEDVKECVEVGKYRSVLKDANRDDSYTIDATLEFSITDQKVYADVPNDEWYSEVVYNASKFGYMTGYAFGNGDFFGPADSIKRGDVAVTLYKMAGNWYLDQEEGSASSDKGFETGFSDVNPNAYYAKAIQWAAKLGIVSGDDNADTFRPEDSVTREELAKMLYKYLELQDKVEDVDEDAVLSAYDDESSVSGWAREYVAYLVDAGIMGQSSGLKGDQPISRAEVAAMTVRAQPDGKLDGFMRY